VRIVLDTNLLVSALISRSGPTDHLYVAWTKQRYELVTSNEQLDEFRRVTRYPRVKKLIDPSAAGTMHNQLRASSIVLDKLPAVNRSRDPADNFLLAMAEEGAAEYLVTGDKRDLHELKEHGNTRILNAADMLKILGIGSAKRQRRTRGLPPRGKRKGGKKT
jgi:putative PIN family toxin of toxin-antitoxin system